MASIKFAMRFIRKNASANTDDTVTITRVTNDNFKLTYTYGDTKFKLPRKMILTDRGVFQWMRSTIRLLENDADPFELVQLDTPFMPSVAISATKLRESYNDILDVLEFHLDNWPAVDTATEEDDEDEDEYADMPDLVPNTPTHDVNRTVRPAYSYIEEIHRSPIHQTVNYQNTVRGRHHLFLDEDE
jgi:hypothetical protein